MAMYIVRCPREIHFCVDLQFVWIRWWVCLCTISFSSCSGETATVNVIVSIAFAIVSVNWTFRLKYSIEFIRLLLDCGDDILSLNQSNTFCNSFSQKIQYIQLIVELNSFCGSISWFHLVNWFNLVDCALDQVNDEVYEAKLLLMASKKTVNELVKWCIFNSIMSHVIGNSCKWRSLWLRQRRHDDHFYDLWKQTVEIYLWKQSVCNLNFKVKANE